MQELYKEFQDGIVLTCVFLLFVPDRQLEPDTTMLFQYPVNRQEYVHNLQYVAAVAQKLSVPLYLQPAEFLENFQPHFLMLQLYYLYCMFKDAQPVIALPGTPQHPGAFVFRDQGREPPPRPAAGTQVLDEDRATEAKDTNQSFGSSQDGKDPSASKTHEASGSQLVAQNSLPRSEAGADVSSFSQATTKMN